MQRERGKKRDKSKKETSSGRSAKFGGTEAGGAGPGKVGRQTKKAERELSNKQEKAKGKAQESRHQNRFPPLFYRAPPSSLDIIGLGAGLKPLGNQG